MPLALNARTGTWTVKAYADPKGEPVGQVGFQVEDFVPQRLKLELSSPALVLKPGEPAVVEITGRFLYGAPAANLKAEAEVVLNEDPNPYPTFPGYRFGLAQDRWTAQRFPVALAGTDAQGKAQAQVTLSETPDTSRPLQARLRVSLFEPGGRPVSRSLNLPYRAQPFAIGIKPRFGDDGVPLGQEAGFDVIALDPLGQPLAKSGLRAELVREDHQYYWYYGENRWNYKLVIRDGAPVASQTLNIAAGQPSAFVQRIAEWGDYRLDVLDPATGVASSVRFTVGWFESPERGRRYPGSDEGDAGSAALSGRRHRQGFRPRAVRRRGAVKRGRRPAVVEQNGQCLGGRNDGGSADSRRMGTGRIRRRHRLPPGG